MRIIFSLFLLVSLPALALHSNEKPADLDALYEQVKHDRLMEQQQNRQREIEFIETRDQRARLLAEVKQRLAEQEQRSKNLTAVFEELETQLTEQETILKQKSGTLGEVFGTVRQVANESRSILGSSLISSELTDRDVFLDMLAGRKQQPTIDEIRELWLLLQKEMTESGKVSVANLPVVTAQGELKQRDVTRIGVFTAFSEGQFLRYLSETDNLVELGRQPTERLQQTVVDFEAVTDGSLQPVVIDPTRGALMALLVQSPDLKERIEQGGWIGLIILVLGAVGLLIAVQRFISLTSIGKEVVQQQKESMPSDSNPLGRILSVYKDSLANDIETLTLKLDEAILREVPKIERGLMTLAILAATAPMLGLLGTVSGMIETFQSITLFGTGDPKLMSGGISQALVTTELGLAVAIPILLIHSFLSGKSNRLVQILDEESAAMIAVNAEKKNGHAE